MNILKPKNNHIEKLKNENIINIQETEKITCCNFENEECNNMKMNSNIVTLTIFVCKML